MSPRPAALLLLVTGLTVGSVADRPTVRVPRQSGGLQILTADLHVHAFPGDGVLPAWQLRNEARRRGIDVIAITNHNQSIAASLPSGAGGGALPLVVPGQEITAPGFHMVAVGVREVVNWRLPAAQAVAAVHAQGGVAIAAHPVRDSWRASADGALAEIDGTEAVHTLGEAHSRGRHQLREFYRRAREQNPTVAPIGSSDFHGMAPLGRCLTYIVVDEVSEQGVLRAIRGGRTVASDNRGALVGDPALVKLVEGAGAAVPAGETGSARTLSVVMVLSALAMLVCFK
jgi:predicted metal-dependent phosphoesterase TrpH